MSADNDIKMSSTIRILDIQISFVTVGGTKDTRKLAMFSFCPMLDDGWWTQRRWEIQGWTGQFKTTLTGILAKSSTEWQKGKFFANKIDIGHLKNLNVLHLNRFQWEMIFEAANPFYSHSWIKKGHNKTARLIFHYKLTRNVFRVHLSGSFSHSFPDSLNFFFFFPSCFNEGGRATQYCIYSWNGETFMVESCSGRSLGMS